MSPSALSESWKNKIIIIYIIIVGDESEWKKWWNYGKVVILADGYGLLLIPILIKLIFWFLPTMQQH